MLYAAIGGMQLKHWTNYFKIIMPTFRVLKSAKRANGCVKADMFKAGNVYFAISIWESTQDMKAFANGGLHGQLTDMAMSNMALFYNHTHEFEKIPVRSEMVEVWKNVMTDRNGKGTVGQLV